MAFKEITGGGSKFAEYFPKKADERKKGDSVVGVYKGKKETRRPDGTTAELFVLEGENGLIGVNASNVLNTKFDKVAEGMLVKVVFEGKEKSAKTGRSYNNFSVWIDDSATPEKEELDLSTIPF